MIPSRKGNCISSEIILRNIYRLLLGNSKFTSFLIYVTISRKSALTLTPDCLRTDISITRDWGFESSCVSTSVSLS